MITKNQFQHWPTQQDFRRNTSQNQLKSSIQGPCTNLMLQAFINTLCTEGPPYWWAWFRNAKLMARRPHRTSWMESEAISSFSVNQNAFQSCTGGLLRLPHASASLSDVPGRHFLFASTYAPGRFHNPPNMVSLGLSRNGTSNILPNPLRPVWNISSADLAIC